MTIKKLGLALLALVIVLIAAPSVLLAQTDAQKKQAKEHYEKATRLYDVGKYGEAIAEYESAYLLVEDPALLFNIGQAYRLWDKPEEAIRTYHNYLRRRPDAPNRTDVERKITDLERLLEEQRRAAPVAPPPTTPVAPPAETPPPVAATPAPAVPPSPAAPDTAATTPPPGVGVTAPAAPPPAPRRWLPYALMGTSGVCLLSAVVAAAVGAQKAKKLETASKNNAVFDPAVEANGKTANGVAVLMSLAGLAAGGAGVYLYYRDKPAAPIASTLVSPVFGPTYAGGMAQFTF
jgi:tetratricopeptide (TPR) repeat protein